MTRLLLAFALMAGFAWPQRRISVIVDTSNSMTQNDQQRYATQIAKILGDLVNDDDQIQVVRMPRIGLPPLPPKPTSFSLRDMAAYVEALRQRAQTIKSLDENCSDPADPSLAVTLHGSDRLTFKTSVDSLLVNDTGTYFVQPVKTALNFLTSSRSIQRMLLFVADSGGFGPTCTQQLTNDLNAFRQTGAHVGLINLGSTAGSFSGNPAFDSTTAAPDSEALVKAVAQFYQRFLGGKKVQTGGASGSTTVTIDPYVKEAFVVIAAEGPISSLDVQSGNPGAAKIEENYRGGGSTIDLHNYARGYRIVRLVNPNAGQWTISAPGVSDGGWMLIQDYSISLRALPVSPVAAGSTAQIQFEAIDTRTGQRITDPAALAGMKVEVKMGGVPMSATANGDGTFFATHRFSQPGKQVVQARVISGVIDRATPVTVEVAEGGWRMVSQSPTRGEVNAPVLLKVKVEPIGTAAAVAPENIVAEIGGQKIQMTPGPDHTYTGSWTPSRAAKETIQFIPTGGLNVAPGMAEVEIVEKRVDGPPAAPSTPAPVAPSAASPVALPPPPPAELAPAPPDFRLGRPQPIRFESLSSGKTGTGRLTFDDAKVPRDTEVSLTTDFNLRGSVLEIETPAGWTQLGSSPLKVLARADQVPAWPVRLRVESCPKACAASELHEIALATSRAGGGEDRLTAPVNVEVVPDPWLPCNWKWVAASVAALLTSLIFYGFVWPQRFGARIGVQLSPEIDLSEGFFYPLRNQPGSRIGFYRHARVFLSQDFRITGKAGGSFVKLRAGNKRVFIQPMHGQSLLRQRLDGEWDRVPNEETVAREGTVYRNEDASIFFDLRLR